MIDGKSNKVPMDDFRQLSVQSEDPGSGKQQDKSHRTGNFNKGAEPHSLTYSVSRLPAFFVSERMSGKVKQKEGKRQAVVFRVVRCRLWRRMVFSTSEEPPPLSASPPYILFENPPQDYDISTITKDD